MNCLVDRVFSDVFRGTFNGGYLVISLVFTVKRVDVVVTMRL